MEISKEQIPKMVREYLSRFHKHYKVPRHGSEDIEHWCSKNLGVRYRDWTYYKGHRDDEYCVVDILDPKKCTVFELRWSDRILGTVDIEHQRLYNK